MATYAIETDAYGAYQVIVTKPDEGRPEIIPGFPTWSDAQRWINERLRDEGDSTQEST